MTFLLSDLCSGLWPILKKTVRAGQKFFERKYELMAHPREIH
jgi:hypothetical protein